MNKDMQLKWEKLHSQSRFRPKYPSEEIVQFIFRNFNRNLETKILDLGCGAGRHVHFLAQEGIDTYGCDISREGINFTQEILNHSNLKATLNMATMEKLPYTDNYFDGIVCSGVLYYCKIKQIKQTIEEIHRILKDHGKALIVVRNVNDYRFNNGTKIEKNTFIINESNSNKCAFNENGMTMHFFDKEEIINLFKGFNNISIDEIVHTYKNGEFKDSNYIIVVQK